MQDERSPRSPKLESVPDLVASLGQLRGLLLDTDAIDEIVWETAMLAVHADDKVDACGVTLLRDGEPVSLVRLSSRHTALEDSQYAKGTGPVMDAIRTGKPVVVSSMRSEQRWGDYSTDASGDGIASIAALPMIAGDEVLGVVTLYSEAEGTFDNGHVLGTLVADLAAAGMWCLLKHADKEKLTNELQQALSSREVIDQAKGILMAREGLSADEAFALLRKTSQHSNTKLRTVAERLVAQPQKA